MKKVEIVNRCASNLLDLCDEHGTPNGFAPFEVARNSKVRMFVGRWAREIAAEAMKRRPGLAITYEKNGGFDQSIGESRYGRFDVSERVDVHACGTCGVTATEDAMTMCVDCPGSVWICKTHITIDEYGERCDACETKRRDDFDPSDEQLAAYNAGV